MWRNLLRNSLPSMDIVTTTHGYGSRSYRRYWTGPARLLDGRLHATRWKVEIASSVKRRLELLPDPPPPGLAAVVIGDRTDSLLYVRRKGEACEAAGMRFFHEHLPENVDQETVIGVLQKLNENDEVHGVLLQLPVPAHLDEARLLECINPRKDVDGLHPNNVGRLAMRGVWRPAFMPCAPLGAMELLRRENISVREKSVAVIGDSNVVGMPMSWLLRDAGASAITVLHSQGVNFLKRYAATEKNRNGVVNSLTLEKKRYELLRSVRRADLIFAAVGSPEIVRKDWVKKGAVVVDIGINAVPLEDTDGKEEWDDTSRTSEKQNEEKNVSSERNNLYTLPGQDVFRVVGDVAAEELSHVASAMTSVPGGAGPMTIAALLSNTYLGASRRDRTS